MRRGLLLLALLAGVLASTASAGADRAGYSCVAGPDVSFRAADGTKLVGHLFGTGRTAVILGHQSNGSLCEWLAYARRLARLGYTAFAIDFRGHGLSQHRAGAAGNRLASDLDAAVKLVRKRGKQKVFLVGASMGGIASLVAGANVKPAVDGVVSVSAPARFMGMNAVGDRAAAARAGALPRRRRRRQRRLRLLRGRPRDVRGDGGGRQAAPDPAGQPARRRARRRLAAGEGR